MRDNLSIGCTDISCIPLISKLFEFGYSPGEIQVYHPPNQLILTKFCEKFLIHHAQISDNNDFSKYVTPTELMINIGGAPFLISDNNIRKFSKGIINLHTGLLEEYRGRWMTSWALINNEKYTGYTWHYINNQFDAGNILYQYKFLIDEQDTSFSLNYKILHHAIDSIEYILTGGPGKPPKKLGRYYNKEKPFDGVIQDDWSNDQIKQFIKAMYHPPHKSAVFVKNNIEHYINTFDEYKKICISAN
jgi:hypothetical protein